MKHKYLSELTGNNNSIFPFGEEDYPGMDPRDTWNMDTTLVAWLYERLRFFQEEASQQVDLNFHKFTIDGEELTQMQCIERMIEDCKTLILSDEYEDDEKMVAAKDDLFKVWSAVHFAMWW